VRQLAEQAVRERRTHLGYLEALLQAELEEREQQLIERRIREARLPSMKTLEEFDFGRNPKVSAQQIHELAKGDYIAKAEPIIFIGDSGTGKTHLLTGLAVAACRPKRRVRFASAARVDQRDGRGQASVATRPCADTLGPLRSDRAR
jgi:DNA replication protein DnaC